MTMFEWQDTNSMREGSAARDLSDGFNRGATAFGEAAVRAIQAWSDKCPVCGNPNAKLCIKCLGLERAMLIINDMLEKRPK